MRAAAFPSAGACSAPASLLLVHSVVRGDLVCNGAVKAVSHAKFNVLVAG